MTRYTPLFILFPFCAVNGVDLMYRRWLFIILTLLCAAADALPAGAQSAWQFDLRNQETVVVMGELKTGIADDFARFVAAHPQLRTVQLNPKLGGDPREALMIAGIIAQRKLATYVPEACVAACTIMFAGSDRRYLESGAKLGYTNFPAASGGVLTEAVWPKIYLHPFPPKFVARAVATPMKELWFPKARELLSSGAISGYVESPDFSSTAVPMLATGLEEGLLTSASLRVFKTVLPEQWNAMTAELMDGFDAGLTLRELRAAAINRASQYRKAFVPYAADGPLWGFFAAVLAEADAIATKDTDACGQYIVGQASEKLKAASDLLPEEYRLQRLARMDEMMLSVDTNRPIPDRNYRMTALAKVADVLGVEKINELEQLATLRDSSRMCDLMRDFYREILKLPEPESAAVLKSLYLTRS
jgi:hypothetical protein